MLSRRGLVVFGLLTATVVGVGLYAMSEYVRPASTGRELTPSDCELLARALRDRAPGVFEMGTRIDGPACPWRALGIKAVEASADGSHVIIDGPRYTLLRNKVVVSVGMEGFMVGSTERCTYRRGTQGWRLSSCVPTSLA